MIRLTTIEITRVEAGQLVVEQHEEHDEHEAADRGRDARADRVGAERRPDRPLFEEVHRRRQRAGAKDQRQVLRLLLREAAGDLPLVGDARLNRRRREHAVVENDREAAGRCSAR